MQLGGDVAGGVVNYSVGYFNGVSDGGSSDSNTPTPDAENDTKGDWAARVFFQPFINSDNFALRGLGFGVARHVRRCRPAARRRRCCRAIARRVSRRSSAIARRPLPAGTTPAVNGTFADGERLRWTPQAYYYVGSFGVLGEYVNVSQDVTRATPTAGMRSATLDNTAWQVQLAWFATGEDEAFRGFTPGSVFSLGEQNLGRVGARRALSRARHRRRRVRRRRRFVRESGDSAASKASAWGVGVNWYLNQNYKWSLNYDVTSFEGGAADGRPAGREGAVHALRAAVLSRISFRRKLHDHDHSNSVAALARLCSA